jgi:hypothetical protein
VQVQLYSFFNLGARWEWKVNATPPAALPPGLTWYPLYRSLGVIQGRCKRVRKTSPLPGFDPGPKKCWTIFLPDKQSFGKEWYLRSIAAFYRDNCSQSVSHLLSRLNPNKDETNEVFRSPYVWRTRTCLGYAQQSGWRETTWKTGD